MLVYHYTTEFKLVAIFGDGILKTTDARIDRDERPAVWFTASPRWEETANKLFQDAEGNIRSLSSQQTFELAGWVRIAVEERFAPHTWFEYTKLSGVSNQTAKALRKVAYQSGSRLSDWRISFHPIIAKDWHSVERWDGNQWVPAVVDGMLIPWPPRKLSATSQQAGSVTKSR
jgi:hypothetical protein